MKNAIEELLTPQELSRYLKVSKNKVYQLVRQGSMPAYVIGGNLRFNKDQIEIWLRSCCGKNILNDEKQL